MNSKYWNIHYTISSSVFSSYSSPLSEFDFELMSTS